METPLSEESSLSYSATVTYSRPKKLETRAL